MRASGILCPVFSLPSRFGAGCFSREARNFIDHLKQSEQRYWQILPLGPAGRGNSPYNPLSSFAGSPLFIDPMTLWEQGLIEKKDLEELLEYYSSSAASPDHIDYEKLSSLRYPLLKKAFSRFRPDDSFQDFCTENEDWLNDASLYSALTDWFGEPDWHLWPSEIRFRRPEPMRRLEKHLEWGILFFKWTQYEFFREWTGLREYAHTQGIEIIGDMPIYTSPEGVECWSHPEIFQLDDELHPRAVSGCPPDAFSPTGQLWGNPLYDWDGNRDEVFRWWGCRVSHLFRLYDIIRIDHFRGLESYYAVPSGETTAINGRWIKGPGMDLFRYLKRTSESSRFLAEDLGTITDDVRKLLEESGFPGMKVLQFAFDSDHSNPYLPDNFETENTVVYTGTHDNDTTRGWYSRLSPEKRNFVDSFLQSHLNTPIYQCPSPVREEDASWALIALAEKSKADTCIIPIQDFLNLDSSARINVPSVPYGNWRWKLSEDPFNGDLIQRIAWLTVHTGRTGARPH